MNKKAIRAYAKINLHLDVISRLENGYHEVRTVMQTVSLFDDVEVTLLEEKQISISCDAPWLPTDRKNLAWRAAEMFFERAGIELGAHIEIKKRIPAAAGLAGGSTDAAAVFVALNELCAAPLSEEELISLASSLGADLPFCIVGGTKYAEGFGEKLSSFPEMPPCYLTVACGREGVSTPWAYGMLDEKYDGFGESTSYTPRDISPIREAMRDGDLHSLCSNLYNVFESVVEQEREEVTLIKRTLMQNGAIACMMSGSGPSVFGIFDTEEAANAAAESLNSIQIAAFSVRPVKDNRE